MNESIKARFDVHFDQFSLHVDLHLPNQGVIGLFGHSGSGKTTLLRCIAGLHEAEGELSVGDEVWQDADHFLPTHKRALAYVFQDARTSLFPHFSVKGNLEYGYKQLSPHERKIEFDQAVEWFGLQHLLARRPDNLSGGERQRVAIARSLLTSPRLLLMDEPLSSLDQRGKSEILFYLQRLHHTLSIPIIYVTHSLYEVARLADHLVLLDKGKVLANGSLVETLSRLDLPICHEEDVGVVILAKVVERDERWHLIKVKFPGGGLWIKDNGAAKDSDLRIRVLARDVSLSLRPITDESVLNHIPATVEEVVIDEHPAVKLVRITLGGKTPVIARLISRSVDTLQLVKGKELWAQIKAVAIVE